MREEKDRKGNREKAIRIFEALSAADSELLKRSEEPSAGAKVVWYRRGRVVAACFCLVVAGALAWTAGGGRMKYANDTAQNSAAPMTIADNRAAGGMPAAEVPEEAGMQEQATESMAYDDMKNGDATQDTGDDVGDGEKGMDKAHGVQDLRETGSLTASEIENCQTGEGTALSLEEARAVELLGDYIPEQVPDGYLFEEAGLSYEEGAEEKASLWVCWCKDMDDIFLSIRQVDAAGTDTEDSWKRFLVDVNMPETYDVHLYEIPYAETVPEEYREVFDHPIFMAEELTKELVQARMRTVEDAGDTDTPRGRFGVLFGNVIVEFSGDLLPEQVWELFSQMK